jgi:neuroligin
VDERCDRIPSGFLSTGDENSPGNYGILDQVMALRWVQENIGAFNGDRVAITVFGPGAGAASASLLAVAPHSKDIVSRVIAQVHLLHIGIFISL